jgi:hypothetical protein
LEQDKAFYCRDGKVAHSLGELAEILRDMPPDEFSHHVNEYKNDFANWIEHVLSDPELAGTIRKSGSRQEILFAMNERIMRQQISKGLREYTERVGPRRQEPTAAILAELPQQEQPTNPRPEQAQPAWPSQQAQAIQQPSFSTTQPASAIQPNQTAQPAVAPARKTETVSRVQDYKEHPYKYFTLREFILGVLLGFVLGFVVSKLIFGLVKP